MSKLSIAFEKVVDAVKKAIPIRSLRNRLAILPFALLVGFPMAVYADDLAEEKAKKLFDRLAGVPLTEETPFPSGSSLGGYSDAGATESVLSYMARNLDVDGTATPETQLKAALLATDAPSFYNVTLKNHVLPWTNEAQTPFVDFNDYAATVIGLVRDNEDFRKVLYENISYVVNDPALPAYSHLNNDHYAAAEDQNIDLKANLTDVPQYNPELAAGDTAGIMTSRAAARAFFIAGTNRAMFRFTLMNHLCNDLEQVKDTTRSAHRIRQDVSRSPGGDSKIFLNACVGCHSGMDPLAQAFAYYDWSTTDEESDEGFLMFNSEGEGEVSEADLLAGVNPRVMPKYHINSGNFPWGYRTPDNHWDNYWREGQNQALGWSDEAPAGSGEGAKSLGQELAQSEAFASCHAKQAFETVCLRPPTSTADLNEVASLTDSFLNDPNPAYQHNLRVTFAKAALYCVMEGGE